MQETQAQTSADETQSLRCAQRSDEASALRNEACELLSSASQRIRNADLNNDEERELAIDTALNEMQDASSLLSIINDPDTVSDFIVFRDGIITSEKAL